MKTLNHSTSHVMGQPTSLASPVPLRSRAVSLRGSIKQILLAGGLAAAAAAPAWAATGGAVDPEAVAKENWRTAMRQNPPQEEGCFRESYPSYVREKIDCKTAGKPRVHPWHRTTKEGEPDNVGNGNDNVAYATGLISEALGSFSNVSVQSEEGVPESWINGVPQGILGKNEYSLQINTNDWGRTAICFPINSCHVWQQFVYAPDYYEQGEAAVFIQYWLLDTPSCPGNWTKEPNNNNCYVNSSAWAAAPDLPITELPGMSLFAMAGPNGLDCATLYNDGQAYGFCVSDGVLQIASVWNKAEFGVFGNGGSSRAQFNSGAGFTELLQLYDGSSAAPKCLTPSPTDLPGTTGETNNLNLGKCKVGSTGVLYPYITFSESK